MVMIAMMIVVGRIGEPSTLGATTKRSGSWRNNTSRGQHNTTYVASSGFFDLETVTRKDRID